MGLADLLKTFKSNTDRGILGELDRHLIKTRKNNDLGRPYETRATGVHHPSSISAEECLRYLVYGWLETEKSNPQDDPKAQRIFGAGHDFGYRMQGYFWDMGLLLGEWLCIKCDHRWLDMENPSPRVCPNCGAELEIWYNLHYLEVPIYDEQHNVKGKADGVLKRDWGRQLIELKTIKNRDLNTKSTTTCFEDLIEPKKEHVAQANLYLYSAGRQYGRLTPDDLQHGLIIYGAKNNHQLKEFPILLLPQVVSNMHTKAEIVDQCLRDRFLPARLGTSKSCIDCKWCPYNDFCWTEHTFEQADGRGL